MQQDGASNVTLQYTLIGNEDGSQNVTAFLPGEKPVSAHSSHPNWDAILAKVIAKDESAIALFDIALTVGTKFARLTERITSANGKIYMDGEEIHNSLTETVIRFLEEGVEDWKPLVAFFENVSDNPNEHSREQLYDWLVAQRISITEDGLMIGYKGVDKDAKGDLVSRTSGTAIADGVVVTGPIPNKIGTYVEMPRTEVMHNPNADCDAGLHVGSYDYADGYASVVIEVHVNPRDVVSVPNSGWKLRTCRYKVIGLLNDPYSKAVVTKKESKAKRLVKKAKSVVVKDVRKGDVYEDTDKRRAGRTLKVTVLGNEYVTAEDASGKQSKVKIERLQSRKYKLVKRGRKA